MIRDYVFRPSRLTFLFVTILLASLALCGCTAHSNGELGSGSSTDTSEGSDAGIVPEVVEQSAGSAAPAAPTAPAAPSADSLRASLNIRETYYPDLQHGDKGVAYQRYIVLHDTEGESDPSDILGWWESNGKLVAAHFIVGRDGSVLQCVPLDRIAHHAGYGDAGHNELYGVAEDGRDDMLGSTPIGSWAPDYGMNA